MLQQTRVETVIPYFHRFLEKFPRIHDLASAPIEEVLTLWSGLGYYRRARSLHAGAQTVVARYSGQFPNDYDSALEIPGVGPYTAGAVLSIAYNAPEVVVDGNVERALTRLYRIAGNPKSRVVSKSLRARAKALMPLGRASDFNQALMELGATVCTPRAPRCSACPLEGICLARAQGDVELFPSSLRDRKTVPVSLHAAVVRSEAGYLIQRVKEGSYLNGLWLFPLADGEADAEAPSPELLRAVFQLGWKVRPVAALGTVRHSITFRRLVIRAFSFELMGGPGPKVLPEDQRWVPLHELGVSIPVSSITTKIARKLEGRQSIDSSLTQGCGQARRRLRGRRP